MKKQIRTKVPGQKPRGVFKANGNVRKLMNVEGVTPRSEGERWRMRFEMGLRAFSDQEYEQVLAYLEPLWEENPTGKRRDEVMRWLGLARSCATHSRDALPLLRESYEKARWDHDLATHYSSALESVGDMEKAEEVAREAMSLYPNDVRHITQLAEILGRRRKLDEAADLLFETQQRGLGNIRLALAFSVVAMKNKREQEAADWIIRELEQNSHPMGTIVSAHFTLGDVHDKMGDYDEAMRYYHLGNEVRDSSFKIEKIQKKRDVAMRMWTPERIRRLREHGNPDPKPVFIVGMPRSGTTLTEQVIGRHPSVFPAGELRIAKTIPEKIQPMFGGTISAMTIGQAFDSLTPGQLKAAGQIYIDHVNKLSGPGFERSIDKMPGNIWHVGMLGALLPNARFIFTRRDPRDVCLSCYFRNFRAEHGYSTDLNECGKYCREVFLMADYWEKTFAEVTDENVFMNSTYENLVSDPETNARKLFELIGIEYTSDAVEIEKESRNVVTLRADQVGRKIDTKSKERWKRYEKHVGPIEEGLGDVLPYIP